MRENIFHRMKRSRSLTRAADIIPVFPTFSDIIPTFPTFAPPAATMVQRKEKHISSAVKHNKYVHSDLIMVWKHLQM